MTEHYVFQLRNVAWPTFWFRLRAPKIAIRMACFIRLKFSSTSVSALWSTIYLASLSSFSSPRLHLQLGVYDYRWDLLGCSPKLCFPGDITFILALKSQGFFFSVAALVVARPVCCFGVVLLLTFAFSPSRSVRFWKVRRSRGGREERGRSLWVCSFNHRSH